MSWMCNELTSPFDKDIVECKSSSCLHDTSNNSVYPKLEVWAFCPDEFVDVFMLLVHMTFHSFCQYSLDTHVTNFTLTDGTTPAGDTGGRDGLECRGRTGSRPSQFPSWSGERGRHKSPSWRCFCPARPSSTTTWKVRVFSLSRKR